MQNYESKLALENAKVISSKNRWETNTEAHIFESDMKELYKDRV